jgi:hypothetical protein
MSKSIRDIAKKETRGRKRTTGPGEPILLRLHPPLLTDLDEWIGGEKDHPTRPEAIRRLLERALAGKAAVRPPNKETAHKASKMGVRELEPLGDKTLPPEEHDRRKRALIRGPKEFRGIRGDQPKMKT